MGKRTGQTKKQPDAARAAADRARVRNQRFAQRHPKVAATERGLRKQQAELARLDKGRDPMVDSGTPETRAKAARLGQGALARMYEGGHLTADELAWSQEIRAVAERIAREVGFGSVSLETRVDESRLGDGSFYEALGAVRAEMAYSKWRASLAFPLPVLTMIVGDVAWRSAAERFQIGPAKAKRLLLEALRSWPDYCRDAREAVDEADLHAAHAGLLS